MSDRYSIRKWLWMGLWTNGWLVDPCLSFSNTIIQQSPNIPSSPPSLDPPISQISQSTAFSCHKQQPTIPKRSMICTQLSHSKRSSSTGTSNIQTWRVFGLEVDPDTLGSNIALEGYKWTSSLAPERTYLSQPVMDALCSRLRIKNTCSYKSFLHDTNDNHHASSTPPKTTDLRDVRVVRRSLDARKKRGRRDPNPNSDTKNSSPSPRYTYVIDIDVTKESVRKLRLKHQPGRCELLTSPPPSSRDSPHSNPPSPPIQKKRVIIAGAGPAGLFCALLLATQSNNNIIPILLERGQPVERRGRSIGALIHRRKLDRESNFAFGEGGAGTWSDGKLTTRIGRNSEAVRFVLKTLVKYGAPPRILVDGSPHLGTENLVRLIRNMRKDLMDLGGEIRFGAKVTQIIKQGGAVQGVQVEYTTDENGEPTTSVAREETIYGDAVVLATGHSARDIYEQLAQLGVLLEPKGFASGFRVEHPQSLINQIQYGTDWSPSVVTGRSMTDNANFPHSSSQTKPHNGRLPVASYRLATDHAFDGSKNRGVYSFCMCPGGQIVPASTDPNELCVNGMSFSRRDSLFANSALVTTVAPNDVILEPYREEFGVLAGIEFQRDMERRAAQLGGGNLVVPVQTVTDFLLAQSSSSTIQHPSSYRLGVRAGVPCHDIYPEPMVRAICHALQQQFNTKMPGYVTEQGLLHAVETRTSSPVRVCRSDEDMQAIGLKRFFPAGEGAGFAGGIVSAAVDGMVVAEAVLEELLGDEARRKRGTKETTVGFDY